MENEPNKIEVGERRFFSKRALRLWGGLVLLVAIVVAPYLWRTIRERMRTGEVLATLEKYEDLVRNDTYGGATPEETLSLFIAALEAGDVELASKYFLPDEMEEIKQNLLQASEQQGGFEGVIERVKKLNLVKKDNKEAFFTIIGLDNVIQMQATLIKNQNNTWKITDL